MYQVTPWKDHAVDPGNTYRLVQNADGTVTLVPAGRVVQQGTNMSAVNFNNMESGIFAANITGAEAIRAIRMLKDKTEALDGLVLTATLTNSQKYPFNNSVQTLALGNDNVRYSKDYTVIVEAEATGGFVGDIIISDKMLNGFKIAFTGSARSVKVKCYVQGGR